VPTLKVQNETSDPIDVVLADGITKVTVEGEEAADLEPPFLRSESMREHLLGGRLSFVLTPLPDLEAEQQALGESVMVALVTQLSGQILGSHQAMTEGKDGLDRARQLYNQRHGMTKKHIEHAEDLGPGARALADAASHFINTTAEQNAVAAIEADIEAKEAEDIVELEKTLAEWYAERQILQAKLIAAQAKLATAQETHAQRYQPVLDALEQAATDMMAANPATDIGNAIPAFP
jgi:hypothetical protein